MLSLTGRVPRVASLPETNPSAVGAGGTRPTQAELDRSVVSGIAWTGAMRSVGQAVQWAAALVVVRLLSPADYGLVAMATAYLGLVEMFTEFGLGAAIVQRQTLSESQIARLGGVSLVTSTFFAAVSVAVSGLVAAFFDEPRVRLIVIVLSSTFVLNSIGVVSRSLMMRDRDFRRLAWAQTAFNGAYAVSSLALAALGFQYWSLVLASIVGAAARMLVSLAWRPHAISWPRDLASISSELWFGWHIVVGRFARYLRKFSDILIVSRVFGTAAAGVYNVAWTQANIPVNRGTQIITELTPAILAAVQNDLPALRRYIRIFTEGIALLAFPATVGLALLAEDFVLLAFGERWAATVGPLRVLALVAALRSITPVLSQVLVARDQAKKSMHFGVAAAVIVPIFLLIGSRWGLTGVALGWLVGHPFVMATVLLPPALRAADMRLVEYLGALLPATVACAVMALAVVGVRLALPSEWPLALGAALEAGVGAAVYGVWVFKANRSRLQSLLALVRRRRG
ncbi:MAG TPA: lipopolysaccharide biosynthesis protein [Longimicrobiales bacterium]|nr:lipopolysaccharide biosynthesis protein [Longimicrobiales bacterium]